MSGVAAEVTALRGPTELQGNSGPVMVKIMNISFHHVH